VVIAFSLVFVPDSLFLVRYPGSTIIGEIIILLIGLVALMIGSTRIINQFVYFSGNVLGTIRSTIAYSVIVFGLAYFNILHRSENALINWLVFGGVYFALVVIRLIVLNVTMPEAPSIPSAPTESAGGTIVGFLADVFLGTAGLGTAFGQGWDEAANENQTKQYIASYQRSLWNHGQGVVIPRRKAAFIDILLSFFVTLGCVYYIWTHSSL
jgi:hypothetical protein